MKSLVTKAGRRALVRMLRENWVSYAPTGDACQQALQRLGYTQRRKSGKYGGPDHWVLTEDGLTLARELLARELKND